MIYQNYTRIKRNGDLSYFLNSYKRFAVSLHNNFLNYGVPQCEHPIFLRSRAQYVPCGHCVLCASRAKKDWIVRCNLELQKYKCGEFITLTFDENHIFDSSYSVVQKFIKRLRKGYGKDLKYFVAYENGDRTGRPHYHILVFGFHRPYPIDPKKWNEFLACRYWKQGIVKAFPMTSGNIPYVCGYVQKKLSSSFELPQGLNRRQFNHFNVHSLNDFELSLSCNKSIHRQEYVKMSKGLGFSWCENLKKVKAVLKRGFFRFGKFSYAIPRALLLRLQQIGNDWMLPDVFYTFLENRERLGKKDLYSYESFFGLNEQESSKFTYETPASESLFRFAYDEPNVYCDFVMRFISWRNKVMRQKALNSLKLRV